MSLVKLLDYLRELALLWYGSMMVLICILKDQSDIWAAAKILTTGCLRGSKITAFSMGHAPLLTAHLLRDLLQISL